MGREIERKFIVPLAEHDRFVKRPRGTRMIQGYLSQDPDRTCRLRVSIDPNGAQQATMTVKTRQVGLSRSEWEFFISARYAMEMMEELKVPSLRKTRHAFHEAGNFWEVDVIELPKDESAPTEEPRYLVLAEVEGPSEAYLAQIELPPWVGEDVSTDVAFAMSNLTERAAREAAYIKAYGR
jgi:adenylate cyclase